MCLASGISQEETWFFLLWAFRKDTFAWWYSGWSSVLPCRAPRYDPFFLTKYGVDTESHFSFVNRLVISASSRQFPQMQYTTPSAQYIEQEEHWIFEEISHSSKHSTLPKQWMTFFDSSLNGWTCQPSCRSLICAFSFYWSWIMCANISIPLVRSSSWSTAVCGPLWNRKSIWSSFFSSSATGFPKPVPHWWESSRWTCQYQSSNTVGCHRVVKDNGTRWNLPNVLSFILSLFPDWFNIWHPGSLSTCSCSVHFEALTRLGILHLAHRS